MLYRKDIQMLRGIAVLFVVLFHLQFTTVQSGFLGVDIFFVISGFLMAILYDPEKKGDFFLRRSKRLLPTYFMIIILTLIISMFLTIPNEYNQVIKQSLYATFFSSNIGFWMQNSYFSKADFNPLLHLWSLGVEIQFYLIVPLLHWFFNKNKLLLPLLLILSLLTCFFIIGISPKTSFFMMPLRLWEFLIGYSIAIYFTGQGNIKYSSLRWIGAIALLFLLLIPTFKLNGESLSFIDGHPGLFALLVSLTTGIILAFGLPHMIIRSKIGSFFELLGKYSYSIYLVHFPIIILFLYEPFSGTILTPDNTQQTILLLILIITLSIISYHFVENPSRHAKKIMRHLFIALALIFLLMAAGYTYQKLHYSKEAFAIFNAVDDRATYRCGKMIRIIDPGAQSCLITNERSTSKQNILLVGDSHADSIKSSFASAADTLNVNVRFIIENSPLRGGMTPASVIREAVEHQIHTIVLHYYGPRINMKNIKKLIQLAEKENIFVAFIMPVPIYQDHIPKVLYNHLNDNVPLPVQLASDYKRSNKSLYETLSSEVSDNFSLYEVDTVFCQKECQISNIDNHPYYFDKQHLTLTGAKLLEPLFHTIIQDSTMKASSLYKRF